MGGPIGHRSVLARRDIPARAGRAVPEARRARSACGPPAPLQQVLEGDRIVVVDVGRSEQQCHGSAVGEARQHIDIRLPGRQLSAVSPLKFVPPHRVVMKPPPQLRARRDLLQPYVDPGLLLPKSARPEAIDQNPYTILRLRRRIGALDRNIRTWSAAICRRAGHSTSPASIKWRKSRGRNAMLARVRRSRTARKACNASSRTPCSLQQFVMAH